MSNVIDFIETMGRDAQLRHAAGSNLQRALTQAQIAPDVQRAILDQDRRQLEALLGATANTCFMIEPVQMGDDEQEVRSATC